MLTCEAGESKAAAQIRFRDSVRQSVTGRARTQFRGADKMSSKRLFMKASLLFEFGIDFGHIFRVCELLRHAGCMQS
jgi:hypothetical protein